MEVLRKEFEDTLPLIEEAMNEADFIAIDTEFTGLSTPDVQFQHADEIATRYSKLKSCVQEFTIIQYGVCAFKRDPSNGNYIAKPFNFYIFGADTHDVYSRRVFSATPSSLAFLRQNKFDFNKLIEEGIPFYNYTEEGSMFQSTQGTNVVNRRAMIKESDLNKSGRGFLEYNRNSISKWLQGNTEQPLIIQVNSNFYKKLIYQEIQDSKYNGFLQATQRDSKHLQISRLKEEDKRKKAANSPKLNFRAVIELIRKAKCPVVAHNAAFDIFHTVDQFWQYLPKTIEEFKQVTNSMWPNIVDTKYLAEYHPSLKNCFNTSVLGSLFNTVYEELKEAGQDIVMAEGFDRYTGSGNDVEHEAGYDAYMTGVIYLAFICFIHEKKEKPDTQVGEKRKRNDSVSSTNTSSSSSSAESSSSTSSAESVSKETLDDTKEDKVEEAKAEAEAEEGEVSASDSDDSDDEIASKKSNSMFMDKAIVPYYGRIYLMRSDIPYINLKGEETIEMITYPNRFYLHNIPAGLTNAAIELLYPSLVPFAVSWINDNNAWIILKDEAKIPLVKTGVLGLSLVQSFLPGCSRQNEGTGYGITKEASRMELITHQQWQTLYGPKKTVNYNSTASILAANNINNKPTIVDSNDSVPAGGAGYDDLDIPLPPSFATHAKRHRDSNEDDQSDQGHVPKARKTE
ncbi:unnamed protein product [Mucor circinelloides]|uniref:Uncharacterized protein n=1 Tax=Mucor circinelloides f. circinelloides (strain 1006PhL) TaxID=1220926 RepID=S2JGY8_MUCC1|nr:hypothetical protein HMPREF1544_04011 [Mucor circinelloides 1006PhL]